MRKPAFGICENKDADQLHSNHEADQGLCFRFTDHTCDFFSYHFREVYQKCIEYIGKL